MNDKEQYQKISAEQAAELLKSGRARPTKGSGLIDVQSLLFSLFIFVLIAAGVTFFVDGFVDTRIIKDYKPETFPSQLFDTLWDLSEFKKAEQKNDFVVLDSIINSRLYDDISPEQTEAIWLYKNELLLATHQYQEALDFSRTLQSRFSEKKEIQPKIFWLRAHAYYYLKRFVEAHQLFSLLAKSNSVEYAEKSAEYRDKIYDLIRTDGLKMFLD